ncbi:dethiobiotin synthase [Flavihumibacter fluvii]|uniref:dethiobiotin synthase n=1 Tax=Flavihumibacter fluvii TaxID=2838157 RepID=UPI001BDE1AFD|nr:dethiobiotin synthase [Flavihumibacter fluvii]ULQ54201.1 dethiobiotin synthase [Flavihumibacter fluvii]
MAAPIFITGIGTGIGKTLVAAIITEALQADYWKPVQAGFSEGTDTEWVAERITNTKTCFHPEVYKLKLPASPHIAAREEGITIRLGAIIDALPDSGQGLIVEGAGGLLVPLNDQEFVADLVLALGAKVVLVSRNYLGSINHSLLTADVCRSRGIDVAGWVFNDQYGDYEADIARWTGLPVLGSIPFSGCCDRNFILNEAKQIAPALIKLL